MYLCDPQGITTLICMLKCIPFPHLCVHLCLLYVHHLSHYYNEFKIYLYHVVQERLFVLIVYAIPLVHSTVDVKVI